MLKRFMRISSEAEWVSIFVRVSISSIFGDSLFRTSFARRREDTKRIDSET